MKQPIHREVQIRPVLEHASCNACGRANYQTDSPYIKMPAPAFEHLYQVVVGHVAIRLCPDCMKPLMGYGQEVLDKGDAFFHDESPADAAADFHVDTFLGQVLSAVKRVDREHGNIDD